MATKSALTRKYRTAWAMDCAAKVDKNEMKSAFLIMWTTSKKGVLGV